MNAIEPITIECSTNTTSIYPGEAIKIHCAMNKGSVQGEATLEIFHLNNGDFSRIFDFVKIREYQVNYSAAAAASIWCASEPVNRRATRCSW
jgi:hypothetical protein